LQVLPYHRRRQGKRYSLALLFCLVILAKLVGEKTMSGATGTSAMYALHHQRTLGHRKLFASSS
jgi:hypothetical protein